MPKLVLRVGTGDVEAFPARPFKRTGTVTVNGERSPSPYFALGEWGQEQGIDVNYVEKIEVTEFDDGSLVAYLTRYELLTEAEFAAVREKNPRASRIRCYPEPPIGRSYVEHHPITSVALLLDQFADAEDVA